MEMNFTNEAYNLHMQSSYIHWHLISYLQTPYGVKLREKIQNIWQYKVGINTSFVHSWEPRLFGERFTFSCYSCKGLNDITDSRNIK